MRIKLILDNDIAIKKRKLWYLVDESSCKKVADVSYLIKKRFFTSDGKISLSLDGFLIPPQEDINIIQDNDIITAKSIQHAPPSSSLESDTSSSESEKDKHKVKIAVKRTIVKKAKTSKPSDVLKKVASSIPKKSPIKCVNILKNAASNILTETNINKTIVPKTIPLSKLGVSNVTGEDSTTESTDSSSSSSTEEETQSVKKKIVLVKKPSSKKNGVIHSKVKSSSDLINTNNEGTKTVKTMNHSMDSSSSSSTEEETQSVKKKIVLVKQPSSEKANDVINSKVKSSSGLVNKNNEDTKTVRTINHSVNSNSKKQSASSSSDSSDSSSDSSDVSHNDKKRKVNVDVSKHLKDKNISSTTSAGCTDNNICSNNNKPNVGNSKAKKMVAKDVYKNQSEFIISKPFTMDNTENIMNGGSLNTKEAIGGNTESKVSGQRNRRRKRGKKENMKNQLQIFTAIKEQVDLNISTSRAATNGYSAEAITTSNENNENVIEDNTMIVLESKPPSKNYDSFVKLIEPPDVGSMIAYKVLEMSPIHYTPEVSEYKEACMKSYDKENNLLELEVSEGSQSKNEGDSQVKGRFEMPDVNEEDLPAQNTVLVRWNELIEPCLII